MIELAQHIKWLLQDNECVIVPGLGGFITHYTPARRVNEENRFLPPTRIVGFNPMLKLNDGLLVQSYMAVHKISFAEAARRVAKEVDGLTALLHENGRVPLENIGELSLSIRGVYSFASYDNMLAASVLYGLGSFEMSKLTDLPRTEASKLVSMPAGTTTRRHIGFGFRFKPAHLVHVAAMIAVVALFFSLPTPIENTEVPEENYAHLLPGNLFEKMKKQSLAITPIRIHEATTSEKQPHFQQKKQTIPVVAKEVKISKVSETVSDQAPQVATSATKVQTAPVQKRYHIIVASMATEKDANDMADKLIKQGYPHAEVIIGNGRMRVSIEAFDTEIDAYKYLNELRKETAYQTAWVVKH